MYSKMLPLKKTKGKQGEKCWVFIVTVSSHYSLKKHHSRYTCFNKWSKKASPDSLPHFHFTDPQVGSSYQETDWAVLP
jgi:hypothetical protein